jgi:hypothetical protein
MPVNLNRPTRWKADIAMSVDMYNQWFMKFAPQAFRLTRIQTTKDVESALRLTDYLTNIRPEILRTNPDILSTLRMSTCPPLAVDRLIGLADASPNLVKTMELKKKLPPRMTVANIDIELAKISRIIQIMIDPDIFVWLGRAKLPSRNETHRAATIVADRLCGAVTNLSSAMLRRNGSLLRSRLGLRRAVTCMFFREEERDSAQCHPGVFRFA